MNDLLDVARLEAGKVTADYVNTDAAELLRLTAAHFDGIAEERAIDYEVIAPASAPAELDQTKIERVLLNLLSNAFKFTPEGGRIVCELENAVGREGKALVVRVSDSGTGIRRTPRAVFERFRQIDGSTTRPRWTGLASPSAKTSPTAPGTIEAESRPAAARSSLILPNARPQAPRARGLAEHERVRSTWPSWLSTSSNLRSRDRRSRDDDRPLVLVVETTRK